MKWTWRFGILIFLIIAAIVWSSFSQEGIDDLDVEFTELDVARNENNTGPVIRRYLVAVSDTLWPDLERYGELMPYTKLGKTEVYFFLEGVTTPSGIQLEGPPFEKSFEGFLSAHYIKNTMGQVSFRKY